MGAVKVEELKTCKGDTDQVLVQSPEIDENEEEDIIFEVNETDISEALDFEDENFELVENKEELSIVKLQPKESTESDYPFDSIGIQKYYIKKVKNYEDDIKAKWETLEALSSKEIAEKCFGFFKATINNLKDCNQSDKIESVHQFIKNENVSKYK
mmetsp:Transcript_18917/g.21707  ORF Transcript_18917/g.21707 Transcript_18917/m.21707 type:complete len:156 (+) Transcript_18917:1731-2198(+)